MTPSTASFIRSLFSKLLPRLPCLQTNFHDGDDLASISLSDPTFPPTFGACPPDTLPFKVVLDDPESSMKAKQINYPWDLSKEMRKTQIKAVERLHDGKEAVLGSRLVAVGAERRRGLCLQVDRPETVKFKCASVLANPEMRCVPAGYALVRGRFQDGKYQYTGALWDILYELASAGDLLLPGSRDKESAGSSTFADYSDWMTCADPQQQFYALPINRTDLGRMPLHGQVNQISDWYSANPYSCYCRRDNVMILIWDRTPSGLKYIPARPITTVTLPFCTLTT
ncbi:uncharacterized protein ARMOST_16867 [Armillaria ostoyae]|uniref:Uncharacterized protein n=1 Tax=Armillaria ostoyae TaxID=47428 RepID=A0A284RXD2_ARMOS|nr:uncharacterized protein ARMOST_16867 [Armillaria ostoyae]